MLKNSEHIKASLSGRRTTPRCHSKIRYKCLRDAIGAADAYMERIVITRSPMTPYYCKIHSCWHIGHSSKSSNIPARYPEKCVSRELLRQEIPKGQLLNSCRVKCQAQTRVYLLCQYALPTGMLRPIHGALLTGHPP